MPNSIISVDWFKPNTGIFIADGISFYRACARILMQDTESQTVEVKYLYDHKMNDIGPCSFRKYAVLNSSHTDKEEWLRALTFFYCPDNIEEFIRLLKMHEKEYGMVVPHDLYVLLDKLLEGYMPTWEGFGYTPTKQADSKKHHKYHKRK